LALTPVGLGQAPTGSPAPARAPYRIAWKVRDGDIFQVNTVDVRQPSAFLKVGEFIPNTKLKLEKLKDLRPPPDPLGDPGDPSELTILNTDTKKSMVIFLGKIADVSEIMP
jgi:hypothetical protein